MVQQRLTVDVSKGTVNVQLAKQVRYKSLRIPQHFLTYRVLKCNFRSYSFQHQGKHLIPLQFLLRKIVFCSQIIY